jgi:uncharacterized protein (TIGR03083 family)
VQLPGERDLLAERAAIIETFDGLTDEEFERGTTLCEEWTPRDVLAHLMGVDSASLAYVRAKGNVKKANAAIVAKARSQSRDRLMHRARHWATHPAPGTRLLALFFLGDHAMHHQDVVRGLGRRAPAAPASRAAMLREGVVLGSKHLLRHRIVPTDGGRAMGFGRVVRGTSDVLGLWLAGRAGLEDELEFSAR